MVQPAPFFFPIMAMSARTVNRQSSLKRRIRQFYKLLNERAFERCYLLIDPRIRDKPNSVTLLQYTNALRDFLDHFSSVKVLQINLDLHLDEPSKLYEGRDFALGTTTWQDETGVQHVFSERWVREGRAWYTRSTGFVTPVVAKEIPHAGTNSKTVKS
jgi:hypothetical protein